MNALESFFQSEENQKKYGFKYPKDESGIHSIIYNGDIHELFEIAYKDLGFTEIKEEIESSDTRPVLHIQITQEGILVLKDTGNLIEADVDGVGTEPNFYIRFADGNDSTVIRFNMIDPELYPDNQSSNYRFSNASLSAINEFYAINYPTLIRKWSDIRNEPLIEIDLLPNYRAINRLGRH